MVERLAQRMQRQPDPTGLAMLGRSYLVLGKPGPAVEAYRRALELKPDDASLLADAADAFGVLRECRLDGEGLAWIDRALELQPDHLKAVSLKAVVARRKGDVAGAAALWTRVVAAGAPDNALVENAREQLALLPGGSKPAAGSALASVSSTVLLVAPAGFAVAPDDTLFVFARAVGGRGPPLAILRKRAKDLPLAYRLDDSLAMSPQARLSDHRQVIVGASISKSGSAMPQAGDLEGHSPPVVVGASGVRVELSTVIGSR
jgi:cytochrome c-type biogenesis protein CcmH